jgi:hypothetical protein
MAVAGLYTTVKNTSGKDATFGFLGLHGKRLDANATYTVPGDLVAKLGNQRSQRQFKALEKALEQGAIAIVSSPAVYLTDSVDGSRDQIALSSNTLGVVAPVGIPTASSSSSSS